MVGIAQIEKKVTAGRRIATAQTAQDCGQNANGLCERSVFAAELRSPRRQ